MSNAQDIEFGLDSFVPISVDASGRELSGDVVIRNTVEEAVLADAVGIDSFNIAEHYRKEMMDSAASIILATVAGRTKRIRLGTAVTVLSTQDPVRVYTEFATLDAVSNGRAQLIAGRGSLIESFPLFGFDLNDYEDLFEEPERHHQGKEGMSYRRIPPIHDAEPAAVCVEVCHVEVVVLDRLPDSQLSQRGAEFGEARRVVSQAVDVISRERELARQQALVTRRQRRHTQVRHAVADVVEGVSNFSLLQLGIRR